MCKGFSEHSSQTQTSTEKEMTVSSGTLADFSKDRRIMKGMANRSFVIELNKHSDLAILWLVI